MPCGWMKAPDHSHRATSIGVTKLAAEGLCHLHHLEHGLNCVILRTGRFFPEDDDTHRDLTGENMKANEFLHRRLTVEDAAEAHIMALDRAPEIGFGTYFLSAPTPFRRDDVGALMRDAAAVIAGYFPERRRSMPLAAGACPVSIGRVYDASAAERALKFRPRTDFASRHGGFADRRAAALRP